MATIKHTSSKNSDLTAPEHYLTFQHNEYTGLPLLDENGQPKLREEYLLDTLECGGQSFAMACLLANRKYGKNFSPDDVKTHQYIISFDPRDAADNGLTLEKAQALACSSARKTFRVILPSSVPTLTGTTELGISTFTLLSAASEYGPSRGSPIWKSPVTGRRA